MYKQNKSIVIICEGKSELAYINEINRYMRENEIGYTLHAKNAGSGIYTTVVNAYFNERYKNKKQRIEIWVDNDIYNRNEKKSLMKYINNNIQHLPEFMFNFMNFEDFLIMHLDTEQLHKWASICNAHDHFETAMAAAVYEPLVKKHMFQDYKKGHLPDSFGSITSDCLARLFKHNKDNTIPFQSYFADFLESILK